MSSRSTNQLRRQRTEFRSNISGSNERRTWHAMSAVQTLEELSTHEAGLTFEEATRRLSLCGPNSIDLKERRSPVQILIGQFTDFMIVVLVIAAILSGIIGDLKDTVVIAIIVFLNGVIGFIQEYRAERALEALQKMAAPAANVIRDGKNLGIPAAELVPGDIVLLEAGGIVPADLRLIECVQLHVQEAALTGESQPIDKSTGPLTDPDLPLGDRRNMAYLGTLITHGRGRGVVVETAAETEFGQIATMLHATQEVETPLQKRLEHFGKRLAFVALTVAAVIFVLGVLRGEPLTLMLMTAISLAVAAIPEALPAVVTISLALGARRMVQKQALVRKLAAVEALGSVTVICSDKTGTLTQNRMSVERLYCDGVLEKAPSPHTRWNELLMAMAISNDVKLDQNDTVLGDSTEIALFNAALQAGFRKPALEERYPRVAELPFDSDRKCMTTLHRNPDGGLIAFSKGAAESLIAHATKQITATGVAPVNTDEILQAAEQMAARGLRVLAFAERQWPAQPVDLSPERIEQDLMIIGLVGIGDPIRSEAAEAVETCRRAGITTIMITGDHPVTAKAIAQELRILDEDQSVFTGRELAETSPEALLNYVDRVRVYARVAPDQKLKIVRALQARGNLVAMTGDGVNDAPALKQAEIGVAMGVTGTDVAKQASSLILLDDDFASIVRAVREGRKIYDNLRRFIRYAVTTNSSEILIMLIAPLLGLPMPLLPLQILWVNLVTDGLPGLALAAEPEERDVMYRPPRPPNESVFAGGLGVHVIWVGTLMALLAVGTQIVALKFGSAAWQTLVISVMAFSQLAHVLAIRSERESLFTLGLMSNKPLLGAVSLTVLLQLAIIYFPVLNGLFKTQPLGPVELLWTLLAGSLVFVAVEIEKSVRRRLEPLKRYE
jgi:P-type Ca2+ transporter type 2C